MSTTIEDRFGQGQSTAAAVKLPCKGVSTSSITFYGEQTITGTVYEEGDRHLHAPAVASVNAGIWIVSTGAWSRAKDFDGARDVVQGTLILVAPGTDDEQFWVVNTEGPIYPGTTAVLIEQHTPEELDLRADLADSADEDNGDAMVAAKYGAPQAVALNLHEYIEDDGLYNVMGFVPQNLKSAIRDYSSTTDVTAYIKYAYTESRAGIRFPPGRFNFDQTVQADQFYVNRSNTAVRGSGPGTQLRKNTGGVVVGNQAILQLFPNVGDVENVEISDLRITGPEAASGGAARGDSRVLAIACHDGSSAHVVRDVLIRNVIGEKIESAVFVLNGLGATGYCERIKFMACVAQNSRQDGFNDFGGAYNRDIEFNTCTARLLDGFGHEHSTSMGLRIVGGLVANCGQSGIGIEYHPTQSLLAQVDIIGVTLRDIYTANYPNSSGISLGQAQNPVNTFIRGCTIQRTGGHGIIGNGVPDNVHVLGNVIQDVGKGGTDKGGIFGFNGTNVRVKNNDISTAAAGYAMDYGVVVQGASATNVIADNEVTGAAIQKVGGSAGIRIRRGIQPFVSASALGNVGVGEDNLIQHTIAAGALEANGQSMRVRVAGYTAANGNNKTVKLYLGATQIWTSGAAAANNKPWWAEATIVRTSSTTALAHVRGEFNGAAIAAIRTAVTSLDYTAALTLKSTGEATSDNDVVNDLLSVEYVDEKSS